MRYIIGSPLSILFLIVCLFILQTGCREKEGKSVPSVHIKKTWKGYELIRNGEPFYIKGASGNSYFEELKNAGGNTMRIYDTTSLKKKLKKADSLGLAIIVDIPIPRLSRNDTIYNNNKRVSSIKEYVKDFVSRYKSHPGLLYWILGNEIEYPDLPGNKNFYNVFNDLIDIIHKTDPNHPVSTAISNVDRSMILSIALKSPKLDLLSINTFGQLSTLKRRMATIAPIWKGPYVLSEWGINGPWEEKKTKWGVPIEQTGSKKAEHYYNRYKQYIESISDNRCLGSLVFYWGQKQERTHTWFSLFDKNGKPSQALLGIEKAWKNSSDSFKGPQIDYILLNEMSTVENIILNKNSNNEAKLILNNKNNNSFHLNWEIKPENWYYFKWDNEKSIQPIPNMVIKATKTSISFVAPKKEGPYRLFVYLEDSIGYKTSANIPFYVVGND